MSYAVSMVAIFPLNLVPFPGEGLNLHIFEDRYKEMVADCLTEDMPFAIAPFIGGQLCEYGGLMEVAEVVHRYPDGRLDIKTKCVNRFRLLKFFNPAPGHQYAGGKLEVLDPDPESAAEKETRRQLTVLIERLYALLETPLEPGKLENPHLSFALGHKLGLSLEQEYELFLITSEEERQQYLIHYLSHSIPTLEELDRTRSRIRLNGHFQKFDPLTF